MKMRNYFRFLAEDHPCVGSSAVWMRPLLNFASFFYRIGLELHSGFYRSGILKQKSFDIPTVSVGNIVWGGTGKTPLVEYIARFYLGRGKIPLVLARGYGQDESKELAHKLPDAKFGIGKNRYQTGSETLRAAPCDIIILDDGFQHWPLKRNLDIVAINALNPFGNYSLIPRGILREPLDGLKRASLIVLTDVNLIPRQQLEEIKKKIRMQAGTVEFAEAIHEPIFFYRPYSRERISPERLHGERVTSFSGIGTPRSFQALLHHIGLKTVRNFEFSDHHRFSEDELKEIRNMKELSGSEEIVTTEKDFYRCEQVVNKFFRPLVLKVRMRFVSGEDLFARRLEGLVQNGKLV